MVADPLLDVLDRYAGEARANELGSWFSHECCEASQEAGEASLGMLSLKLGRSIQWDGEKEQVIGDAEANKLLRREYRGPWQYPS